MRSTLIKKLSRATASAVTVLGISAGCITMGGTSAYAAAPAAVTPAKSTAAKVSIVVASSANPAAPGQTVTFTTTLKGSSSKLPVPTGTVVFVIDGDT